MSLHRCLLHCTKSSLEIETLGSEGLRYRRSSVQKDAKRWKHLAAYEVGTLKDTAGAGDWCSAGLLFMLGKRGEEGFQEAILSDLDDALNFGQALAALNCGYEGARGGMYSLSKQAFEILIHKVWSNKELLNLDETEQDEILQSTFTSICSECQTRSENSPESMSIDVSQPIANKHDCYPTD